MLIFCYTGAGCMGWGTGAGGGDKCCAHAGQGVEWRGWAGMQVSFPCFGAETKQHVLEQENIYLSWTNYIFVCYFIK